VPQAGFNLPNWLWRELREGGRLYRYLEMERARRAWRVEQVRRRMAGFQQNSKSEMRLVATVPARDYVRQEKERPGFFEDDWNLRFLKRKGLLETVYL
jgi:hypothetical protein